MEQTSGHVSVMWRGGCDPSNLMRNLRRASDRTAIARIDKSTWRGAAPPLICTFSLSKIHGAQRAAPCLGPDAAARGDICS